MDQEVLYVTNANDEKEDIHYPGNITIVNYDGTFAVDYLYTDFKHGSSEETKHLSHVFAKDLRVRTGTGSCAGAQCDSIFRS